MNKYKLLATNSNVHGKGLFAMEDIPEGEIIIEYTGEWITTMEAEKREIENDKKGITYILYYDKKHQIDGSVGGNESRYINHSCDPNCEFYRKGGRAYVKTKKMVRVGEELSFDYAFDKDDRQEKCFCKSKKCRGVMNQL